MFVEKNTKHDDNSARGFFPPVILYYSFAIKPLKHAVLMNG